MSGLDLLSSMLMGTFSASGSSVTFNAQMFVAHIRFSPDAVGTVTVMRSKNGSPFAPVTAGSRINSALTASGDMFFVDQALGDTGWLKSVWRIDCQLTAGSVFYQAYYGLPPAPDAQPSGAFAKPGGVSRTFRNTLNGFVLRVDVASTTAMVSITRSTDGVTFSPYRAASNESFRVLVPPGDAQGSYRLECTMDATDKGSVAWSALLDYSVPALAAEGMDPICYFGVRLLNPSAAQIQAQYVAKWTPLTDADIAGDLTLWKTCAGNTIAKLVVPAVAKRCKSQNFRHGSNREIRAEYANVISVTDGNGVAVAQAASFIDPSTIYKAGTQVTAHDLYGTSIGDFTSPYFTAGINGYLTPLEAAAGCLDINSGAPLPNLTALGL